MKKISAKTLIKRYNKINDYLNNISDLNIVVSSIYDDYYITIYSYNIKTNDFKSIAISLLIRVSKKRLQEIGDKLK